VEKLQKENENGVRKLRNLNSDRWRVRVEGDQMARLFYAGLALIALTVGPAFSEPVHSYVLIGARASDEVVEFVDTSTINKSGTTATAWVLLSNPEPIFVAGARVEYGLYQYRYFCHRKMTQVLYGAVFSNDGNPLSVDDEGGKMQPVVPESLEETALAFVCDISKPLADVPPFSQQTEALAFAHKLSARLKAKKPDGN
jgi:hypothetical protein